MAKYDPSRHLHLGYYERGADLEAVALKLANSEMWHVFFPFERYGIPLPKALQRAPRNHTYGTLIFSTTDIQSAQETFEKWVVDNMIPA